METLTIVDAVAKYIDSVKMARSPNTGLTYFKAMSLFVRVLAENSLDSERFPCTDITEDAMIWFIKQLRGYAPATEQLYITAVFGFYRYLVTENLLNVNIPRLEAIRAQRSRRIGQRLPQFPRREIDLVLEYVNNFTIQLSDNLQIRLRELRDRAFIITLADTGLRVHEACNLRRGDIDWSEDRAVIIGKGNKQAVVRFSSRSTLAIKDYLSARASLDGVSGRPLPSLPLFARHDKGAGKKIKPVTPTTGRNIVAERVRQALGNDAEGRITPHSFRHYFVTEILRGSGNLKLAQELARHANIQTTSKYAHLSDRELDEGYRDIFEEGKR